MRRAVAASLALAVLLAAGSPHAAQRTVDLEVAGVGACPSCAYIVERSLSELEGVEAVDARWREEIATVTYDDEAITLSEITEATAGVGFPSTPVKDDVDE